jgi:hypothetical protein
VESVGTFVNYKLPKFLRPNTKFLVFCDQIVYLFVNLSGGSDPPDRSKIENYQIPNFHPRCICLKTPLPVLSQNAPPPTPTPQVCLVDMAEPPPRPLLSSTSDEEEDDDDDEKNQRVQKRKAPTTKTKGTADAKKKKPRRGLGYTQAELMSFLDLMEAFLPIGPVQWETVVSKHRESYPVKDRDATSLRTKFNRLVAAKPPTGDAECPEEVRRAKRIYKAIEQKSDASQEVEDAELGFALSDVEVDDTETEEQVATNDSSVSASNSNNNNNNNNNNVAAAPADNTPPFRLHRAREKPAPMDRFMEVMMANMMSEQTRNMNRNDDMEKRRSEREQERREREAEREAERREREAEREAERRKDSLREAEREADRRKESQREAEREADRKKESQRQDMMMMMMMSVVSQLTGAKAPKEKDEDSNNEDKK